MVGWLVHVGASVSENQDMVEVMTDKATVTIGVPKQCKVVEVRVGEGDVVPVGSVLVVLDVDVGSAPVAASKPGSLPASPPPGPKAPSPPAASPSGVVASAVGDIKDVLPGVPRSPRIVEDEYQNGKPLASPATRKLAREQGIDLRRVRPTGEGGRVTREDVERYGAEDARPGAGPSSAHAAVTVRPAPGAGVPPEADAHGRAPVLRAPTTKGPADHRVPLRRRRNRINENRGQS